MQLTHFSQKMNAYILDAGNTRIKLATFQNDQLAQVQEFPNYAALLPTLETQPEWPVLLSSVREEALPEVLEKRAIRLQHDLPLPLKNAYATPESLGPDRIAAAVGAWAAFPEEAALVLDAGTCLTYEFVRADGTYLGGGIAPGLRMRLRAMHQQTGKLPEAPLPKNLPALVGTSTQTCLQSGAWWGMCAEMEGIIAAYRREFGKFNVLFCGGDARFFESHLKERIFVRPNLVLEGLFEILKFQFRSA